MGRPPPPRVLDAYEKGNPQALIDWFNGGADGQIAWCQSGDFDDCVEVASAHLDNPQGFCNERHQDACGGPPGSEDKHTIGGTAMGAFARDTIITDWFANRSASYEAVTAAATAELGEPPYWALISQAERDKHAKSGAARPDGSYPITACEGPTSVDSAIHAVGRGSGSHDGIRKHIITRANSLGCSGKIPDNWNSDGSLKGDTSGSSSTTSTAFAPPPPPPRDGTAHSPPPAVGKPGGGEPSQEAKPAPDIGDSDKSVAQHITAARQAIHNARQAQSVDPGNEVSPDDQKVLEGLEEADRMLAQLAKDQNTDMTGGEEKTEDVEPPKGDATPPGSGDGAPTSTTPHALASGDVPGNGDGIPDDADDSGPSAGDIEANVQCQDANCKHMAIAHADTADGKNTGACSMTPAGHCTGMVPPAGEGTPQAVGVADTGGPTHPQARGIGGGDGGAPAPAAAASMADAPPDGAAVPPPPGAPPEPQAPEMHPAPQLPPLDPMPNVALGAEFAIPVAWLEGVNTGDGRRIAPEALTWRTPPLPLMGLDTSSHDPGGFSPNDPATLVGRIEEVTRDGSVGTMKGHFLATKDGAHFAELVEQMGRMGVSIDVGGAEVQITPAPLPPAQPGPGPDIDVFDLPLCEVLTAGEVMGATVCPFPAFAGAFIVIGDGSDVKGPELPEPTPEQAAMGIRYVDSVECEPCSGAGLTAASLPLAPVPGAGPIAPPLGWFEDPRFAMNDYGQETDPREDPRLRETIDAKTGKPSGKFGCPITITDDGRYYGHVALWGVCHQSPSFLNSGRCVLAPKSKTAYSWFHGRGAVRTAEGEVIDVGRVTADTGHASVASTVSAAMAIAHYDNSGLTAAVVRAGEDRFGIWVAGSVHPSCSQEQIFTLRACPPSGDWRPVGRGDELVAVLHVNEPGFPIAKATLDPSSGQIKALVAAGVPLFELPAHAPPELSLAERVDQIERGMRPALRMAAADARRRMGELRAGR